MMKLFHLFMISLIFLVIGCSNYGSITNESVIVKFPIKLKLDNLGNNWKSDFGSIDTFIYGDGSSLLIKNDSILYVTINDLVFKGNFKVELRIYPDEWCVKEGDNILLWRIDIFVLDQTSNIIYDSLRLQPILLVPADLNDTEYYYDMDNKVRYSINIDFGWFRFQGLEYLRDPNQTDYRDWIEFK